MRSIFKDECTKNIKSALDFHGDSHNQGYSEGICLTGIDDCLFAKYIDHSAYLQKLTKVCNYSARQVLSSPLKGRCLAGEKCRPVQTPGPVCIFSGLYWQKSKPGFWSLHYCQKMEKYTPGFWSALFFFKAKHWPKRIDTILVSRRSRANTTKSSQFVRFAVSYVRIRNRFPPVQR